MKVKSNIRFDVITILLINYVIVILGVIYSLVQGDNSGTSISVVAIVISNLKSAFFAFNCGIPENGKKYVIIILTSVVGAFIFSFDCTVTRVLGMIMVVVSMFFYVILEYNEQKKRFEKTDGFYKKD